MPTVYAKFNFDLIKTEGNHKLDTDLTSPPAADVQNFLDASWIVDIRLVSDAGGGDFYNEAWVGRSWVGAEGNIGGVLNPTLVAIEKDLGDPQNWEDDHYDGYWLYAKYETYTDILPTDFGQEPVETKTFNQFGQGPVTVTWKDYDWVALNVNTPPAPEEVRINIGDAATVAEGGMANFKVTLDRAIGETVALDYLVTSGSAEAGTDFVTSVSTVTFAPGQLSSFIRVETIQDRLDEEQETFTVRLSSPRSSGDAIVHLVRGTAIGTISDDDLTCDADFDGNGSIDHFEGPVQDLQALRAQVQKNLMRSIDQLEFFKGQEKSIAQQAYFRTAECYAKQIGSTASLMGFVGSLGLSKLGDIGKAVKIIYDAISVGTTLYERHFQARDPNASALEQARDNLLFAGKLFSAIIEKLSDLGPAADLISLIVENEDVKSDLQSLVNRALELERDIVAKETMVARLREARAHIDDCIADNAGATKAAITAAPATPEGEDQVGLTAAVSGVTEQPAPALHRGSDRGEEMLGSTGTDIMLGWGGNDLIKAYGGDDVVLGGAGNDNVAGGDGKDVIVGENGSDLLKGGAGNDLLLGGSENDSMYGGAGSDTLLGEGGVDIMFGGGGRDVYIVAQSADKAFESISATDTTDTGGVDTVVASVTWKLGRHFEHLALGGRANLNGVGNGLNNRITGNGGDNTLEGGRGSDRLNGNAGADILYAGSGYDKLNGGKGKDHLHGGNDSAGDVFIFGSRSHSAVGVNHDVIHKFTRSADHVDLRSIDADASTLRMNDDFTWGGKTSAAHSVWWKATSNGVLLQADITGDKTADFEVLIKGITAFGLDNVLL